MKNHRKTLLVFLILTVCLAAAVAVMQTIVTFFYLDFTTHIFSAESIAPAILNVFMVLCTVLFFSFLIVWRKSEKQPLLPAGGVGTKLSALICAVVLLGSAAIFLLLALKNPPLGDCPKQSIYNFRLVLSILSLPTAGFFFAEMFAKRPTPRPVAYLSLFTVVWLSVFLISVYYDHSIRLNSPIRIIDQIALISLMLSFLYEIRFHIGKPSAALYFTFSFCAVFFASASAVPHLVLTAAGIYEFNSATMNYMFMCVSVLYIIARSASFLREEKKHRVDTVA